MFKIDFIGQAGTNRYLRSQLRSEVKRLGDAVFAEVKKTTPVDTGRARAGWRKSTQDTAFTIENSVPYIGVLDKGRHMTNRGMRGSKQAPQGIVKPSLESIKRKN